MRVAHLKRMYLLPTETFVYTQLRYAAPDQGHLICRDLDNVTMFPGVTFSAFQDTPLTWQRRWSDACYRTLRYMTAHERNFYLETIKGLGVDLLHAHYVVDAAYFIDVKRMSRLPLVVSCYGYDVSNFPNVLLGAGRRYLHPVWDNADLILAMSEDMRSDIVALGCPPEKVRVHYHGINLERFPAHPHKIGRAHV